MIYLKHIGSILVKNNVICVKTRNLICIFIKEGGRMKNLILYDVQQK